MSAGKAAAMASHLSATAIIEFLARNPERLPEFRHLGTSGTRVILRAKTSDHCWKSYRDAAAAGICAVVFHDEGHVHPPHFDGSRVFVGMAIGPCSKEEARPFVKRFPCA
jgi:PTH2 family peptidyl-tRNA hydrolase